MKELRFNHPFISWQLLPLGLSVPPRDRIGGLRKGGGDSHCSCLSCLVPKNSTSFLLIIFPKSPRSPLYTSADQCLPGTELGDVSPSRRTGGKTRSGFTFFFPDPGSPLRHGKQGLLTSKEADSGKSFAQQAFQEWARARAKTQSGVPGPRVGSTRDHGAFQAGTPSLQGRVSVSCMFQKVMLTSTDV